MEKNYIEELKTRFQFNNWNKAGSKTERIFIWGFQFSGHEIDKMKIVKNRSFPIPQESNETRIQNSIALWQPEENPDSLLKIEVIENRDDNDSTDNTLLQVLSNFESPAIKLDPEKNIGEICFGGDKPYLYIFKRGNLVVILRNAGKAMVDLTEHARNFDRLITANNGNKETMGRLHKRIAPLLGKETVDNTLKVSMIEGLPIQKLDGFWYKLVSRTGFVQMEGEKPTYVPGKGSATHIVSVYGIAQNLDYFHVDVELQS